VNENAPAAPRTRPADAAIPKWTREDDMARIRIGKREKLKDAIEE